MNADPEKKLNADAEKKFFLFDTSADNSLGPLVAALLISLVVIVLGVAMSPH